MKTLRRIEQEHLVIAVSGRLDANSASSLEEECNDVIAAGHLQLILDFNKLEYISSAGLRVLLSVTRKLKTSGGCLSLCAVEGLVKEVISMAGFDGFLTIYTNLDKALAKQRGK